MRKNKPIELSALRIFAMVVESETLTHAARRLGITQSAVSQAIKQLERQLQVELIVRRSRPLRLSPSGQVLNQYAMRMIADNSRLIHDVKIASNSGLSNLNVGMIDSFGDALGLQFITKIKPLVAKISLRTGLSLSLSQALHDHDIDILITSDTSNPNQSFTQHALVRDSFLVVAPEKSLGTNTVNVEQLAQKLPFIHYSPNSRIGAQSDLIARRLGVDLNTHYELDSTQTLLRFVRANYGWAITSALCLVRYPNLLEGVRVINLNNGANARNISLINRKDELGKLPIQFAKIARGIFNNEVSPRLEAIAPWLPSQAYTIDKLELF